MSKDQYLQQQATAIINYYKSGDFKQVIEKGNVLIKKFPDQIIFYNATSLALCAIGKFKEALKLLHDANNNFIKNIYIYNNLGMIYYNLNQHDDAKLYLNKALKLNDEHIGALVNLGNVFLKEGNAEEAKKLYEKALSLNPPKEDQVNIMNALGNYYQQVGDFNNAEKVFGDLSLMDLNNTQADKQRSMFRKYKDEKDSHFKIMLDKLDKIKSDTSKEPLLFAIGKAYEDIKNYKKSFKFFKMANDLAYKRIGYDIKKDENLFNNIKDLFDNFNHQIKKNTQQKIIFILGMPRSGTTLVEQILSSHNKVFGAGELPFLSDNFEKYRALENIKSIKTEDIQNAQIDYIKKLKSFNFSEEFVTDKSPLNFRWIGFIKNIFPNSKIIHCNRDPMDSCFSNFKNSFSRNSLGFSYNLETLGLYYNLYKDLMQYWNKKFPKNIYNLEYENLVKQSETEIKNILNFCDLEWDEKCLEPQKNKKVVATASLAQVRAPIYRSSVKNWQNFKSDLGDLYKKVN